MSKTRQPNFGDRESRLRKAYERLGTTAPRCLICGNSNPLCLELHHPAQRQYDNEVRVICSNHHADASDKQYDHPPKIIGCSSALEPIAHWLLGLGDLLSIASEEPDIGQLKELLAYVSVKLHQLGRILIEIAQSMIPAVGAPT